MPTEKVFHKIQHPFLIEKKIRTEGNVYNMIKAIYEKLITNMILNNERLKAFALILGKRQRCLLSLLLFNIVLEILARKLVKKEKWTQI